VARTDIQDIAQLGFDQQQSALTNLGGLNSSFSGINNAGDARKTFGIKGTDEVYAPLFKMLAGNRGRRMRGASLRAGRSASPEMGFSNVEGDYENSLQGLLGQKGQADLGQDQFVANLLSGGFNSRDQFGLNKYSGMGALAGNIGQGAISRGQFDREGEGASWLDIAGMITGAGAKVAGAAIGKPSTTFDFGNGNAPGWAEFVERNRKK